MKIISFCLLFFSGLHAFTQDTVQVATVNIFDEISKSTNGEGEVTIQQDPLIKQMVNEHAKLNRALNYYVGYRIFIFTVSSATNNDAREQAYSIKHTFEQDHPNIPCYVIYNSPDFKVYVGDFRRKIDAMNFERTLKKQFPNSFIRQTKINFPD